MSKGSMGQWEAIRIAAYGTCEWFDYTQALEDASDTFGVQLGSWDSSVTL